MILDCEAEWERGSRERINSQPESRISPSPRLAFSPSCGRIVALEEHEMLPGQLVELLDELEAVGRKFLHDLCFAHFVQRSKSCMTPLP